MQLSHGDASLNCCHFNIQKLDPSAVGRCLVCDIETAVEVEYMCCYYGSGSLPLSLPSYYHSYSKTSASIAILTPPALGHWGRWPLYIYIYISALSTFVLLRKHLYIASSALYYTHDSIVFPSDLLADC